MGRRSLHTADELKELIIGASTELIQEAGLTGLSAREIARRINYSPGTIYNSFESLDDVVLTIEGRLLDRLADALAEVPAEEAPGARIQKLAARYLAFAADNPKLWDLLFEHHISASRAMPEWYQKKLETVAAVIEDALRPLVEGEGPDAARRTARALWAGMHGISSLTATDKLSIVPASEANGLMVDLVHNFLAGLTARR